MSIRKAMMAKLAARLADQELQNAIASAADPELALHKVIVEAVSEDVVRIFDTKAIVTAFRAATMTEQELQNAGAADPDPAPLFNSAKEDVVNYVSDWLIITGNYQNLPSNKEQVE